MEDEKKEHEKHEGDEDEHSGTSANLPSDPVPATDPGVQNGPPEPPEGH